MVLLEISIASRVIVGISAMLLLFGSFLVAFISNQRKKLQYHKNLQSLHEKQQQALMEQNANLEQRVSERTAALEQQTIALKNALTDLKTSQMQLIQKEKMASLGELTAGIAHEMRNPLNFVNNFAEINAEMLEEMKEKITSLGLDSSLTSDINSLIDDITENLQKIVHHGKRADGIVKNMLQHARTQSGIKEPTDLNALAEEYMNLSYHGYRATHKEFNCTIKKSFDSNIGKINIVPGDIGRVLINLFSNSFYSVSQKKDKQGNEYEPTVSFSTKKVGDKVELTVWDNGMGISQEIIEKIYQPFFTTKPSGEGTGMGLSMSYDILKSHGASLKVDSIKGEFASFTVDFNC